VQSGLTRSQVDALIRKYGQIPALKVTQTEARTARAEANIEHLKQNMNSISAKTVYVSADTSGAIASIQQLVSTPATKYVQVVTLNGPAPSGGRAALATGGPVRGPGSGTSDSIPMARCLTASTW
jgi:hypothetical protein